MPVRSLSSRVLKWPDCESVVDAVRRWAESVRAYDEAVQAIGYFGSYARGDAGVGSDLDIIIILSDSELPFERRAARYDTTCLPVPADLLVYTAAEWQSMLAEPRPFAQRLDRETVWLYRRQ